MAAKIPFSFSLLADQLLIALRFSQKNTRNNILEFERLDVDPEQDYDGTPANFRRAVEASFVRLLVEFQQLSASDKKDVLSYAQWCWDDHIRLDETSGNSYYSPKFRILVKRDEVLGLATKIKELEAEHAIKEKKRRKELRALDRKLAKARAAAKKPAVKKAVSKKTAPKKKRA